MNRKPKEKEREQKKKKLSRLEIMHLTENNMQKDYTLIFIKLMYFDHNAEVHDTPFY